MTYEVTFTVTYKTTVQVGANDEYDAYNVVESMIESGKVDLDMKKDLLLVRVEVVAASRSRMRIQGMRGLHFFV